MTDKKCLIFTDIRRLILEKHGLADSGILKNIFDYCRIVTSCSTYFELEIEPFLLWNGVYRGNDPVAYFRQLIELFQHPPEEVFFQFLQASAEEGKKLIHQYKINAQNKGLLRPAALPENPHPALRDGQRDALAAVCAGGNLHSGIVALPGGYGKTLFAIELIRLLNIQTIVLVPSIIVQNHWIHEIKKYTDWTEKAPSLCTVDVFANAAKYQSGTPHQFSIIDEVHNADQSIVDAVSGKNCIGLTATCMFRPGLESEVFTGIGPVLYNLTLEQKKEAESSSGLSHIQYLEVILGISKRKKAEYLTASGEAARYKQASCFEKKIDFAEKIFLFFNDKSIKDKDSSQSGNTEYSALFTRIESVINPVQENRRIIFFCEYADQITELEKRLHIPSLTGKTPREKRQKIYDSFNTGSIQAFISSRVTNESVNLPDADTIIQLSGQRKNAVEEFQRLGRLLRQKEKTVLFISLITGDTIEEAYAYKRKNFFTGTSIRAQRITIPAGAE